MNSYQDKNLGITATVPTEVALAAGRRLVDLNNALVKGTAPGEAVREAELRGFPRNSCAWIKGIYTTIERLGLRELVGVIQGDCSNTEALLELLRDDGLRAVPFAYPASRKPDEMKAALTAFAESLGTSLSLAERWRKRLEPIRQDLNRLDELVVEGKRRDAAYFSLALSASDYGGDVDDYARRLSHELTQGEVPDKQPIRLAYLGVPPAFTNLLEQLNALGASLVYAEIPHQFTMPFGSKNLTEQYLRYSYPYGMAFRVREIE
ncbi:2-hydroxyacyl-CoA dehydratase, partial [bacterium]|nr:2-hydroxyacyl-CoA dehydratase [bacterium]